MRNKLILLVATASSLAVTRSDPAVAADTGGAALGLCAPDTFADMQNVVTAGRLGNYLVAYTSDFSAQSSTSVACGMVRLTSSSPRTLFVDYEDKSTTTEIACTVGVIGWSAGSGTVWSETQRSGVASYSSGAFQFTIPSGSLGYVRMRCTLPKRPAGASYSTIAGFNLQ